METETSLDCVFNRSPYWFLGPNAEKSLPIAWRELLPVLTSAFNGGEDAFSIYSDSKITSGLMFLAGFDGIGKTIFFDDEVELTQRSRFLLSHVVLFQEVVVPRARNSLSELNIVCFGYWDSLIECSGLNTTTIQAKEIFRSFHQATYSLFGLLPALDSGISEAFEKWFPDLLEAKP